MHVLKKIKNNQEETIRKPTSTKPHLDSPIQTVNQLYYLMSYELR